MTFFGKLFVMLNLTLSLVMAGLAFALWMTRIDWSDKAGKQGEPDGQVLILSKQLKKEVQASAGAGVSWTVARKGLYDAETDRASFRPKYVNKLDHLLKGATPASPAEEVEIDLRPIDPADPTGKRANPRRWLAVIDPQTRFPQMKRVDHNGKDNPLLSRANYVKQIETSLKGGVTLEGALVKHYLGDMDATDKLVGNLLGYDDLDEKWQKRKGTDPGLIQLLFTDAEKREGLEDEMRLIESQDVNTQIDALAVNRSYGSVEERIQELEEYLRKRGVSFTTWQNKTKTAKKD